MRSFKPPTSALTRRFCCRTMMRFAFGIYGVLMSRLATASLRILAFASALALLVPFAPAQTFTVLHNFSNGADGDIPQTGTVDAGGNFYGTTYQGGTHQCGLVFKLMPRGTSWVLDPLYEFPDSTDACHP